MLCESEKGRSQQDANAFDMRRGRALRAFRIHPHSRGRNRPCWVDIFNVQCSLGFGNALILLILLLLLFLFQSSPAMSPSASRENLSRMSFSTGKKSLGGGGVPSVSPFLSFRGLAIRAKRNERGRG